MSYHIFLKVQKIGNNFDNINIGWPFYVFLDVTLFSGKNLSVWNLFVIKVDLKLLVIA